MCGYACVCEQFNCVRLLAGRSFARISFIGFHLTYPDAGFYLFRVDDVRQDEHEQVFIFVARLAQHVERFHCNVRVIVRDYERAVLVVNRTNGAILVG